MIRLSSETLLKPKPVGSNTTQWCDPEDRGREMPWKNLWEQQPLKKSLLYKFVNTTRVAGIGVTEVRGTVSFVALLRTQFQEQ